MAYTIPSGYEYYDQSASKTYTAGQPFNYSPGTGDLLRGVSTSLKGILYIYSAAQSVTPVVRVSTDPSILLDAGWYLQLRSHTGTATSYTVLSAIAGKNVVHVSCSDQSKITTLGLGTTSHLQYIGANGENSKITKITGTMPQTLRYFSAYKNKKLISVPNFNSQCYWTYGYCAFQNCTSLITAPTLPSGMTNLYSIFQGCTSLTTAADIPSAAVSATNAYEGCVALTAAPRNNSLNLTSLNYCFSNCTALTTASSFTIQGASNLKASSIFAGCTNLVNPPSIPANSNVQDLTSAFSNCSKITSIPDLPSSVALAGYICYNCESITSIPNMSQTSIHNLNYAFRNCVNLETIDAEDLPHGALSLYQTFAYCTKLKILPILYEGITSLQGTFAGCSSLIPQNIYIPNTVTSLNSTFSGCNQLSGIVTLNRTLGEISGMFKEVVGPIIIIGDNNYASTDIALMGNNVYKELEIEPSKVEVVRCSDMQGTLDDNGNYIHLIAEFNSIIIPDNYIKTSDETIDPTKTYYEWINNEFIIVASPDVSQIDTYYELDKVQVYVPKVYIKRNQQTPQINWKFTNLKTDETITIPNSTSISSDKILAGNLISSGRFESYFLIGENEVLNYQVEIATSAKVYSLIDNVVKSQEKVWNGKPGSAIFTSSTFIFDATPDGKSFKIGGPIDDSLDAFDNPVETGFIVGNPGIIDEDEQYPSTFNGPATFNSTAIFNSTIIPAYVPGLIQMYAGSTRPNGWLFCDGSEYLIDDYPELYAVIRDVYGTYVAPSDSYHFRVPDFRGRVPVGVGEGTATGHTAHTLGQIDGAETVTLNSTQIPAHTHGPGTLNITASGSHGHKLTYEKDAASGTAKNRVVPGDDTGSSTGSRDATKTATHTHASSSFAGATAQNTGGGQAHNNMQPYIGINYIIATGKTY